MNKTIIRLLNIVWSFVCTAWFSGMSLLLIFNTYFARLDGNDERFFIFGIIFGVYAAIDICFINNLIKVINTKEERKDGKH